MSATLDAALAYAARGWRVHRLYHLIRDRAGVVTGCACEGRTGHTGPDGAWVSEPSGCADPASKAWGKHPRGAWHKLTTTDPAAIRALWGKAPRAQVGIACGPESDLWVLDIDGDGGRAQLAALEAQHGALPPTWTVATGSGGEQRYFRWPLCGRKPANRAKMIKAGAAAVIGEGLDARGAGGQVVAPPSENRNGPYRVALDAPLAYAPGWLLDLVCPPPPKPLPAAPPPEVGVAGEGLEKRLRGLLAYVCARVAETTAGGQDALNKAAWTIGRHQAAHPGILSDAEIVAALESAAEVCGLPMSGARTTIRSTLAKASGEPVPLGERERPDAPPKAAARLGPQEARHAPRQPDPAPHSPRADPGQEGAAQAAGEAPEQDAPPPQIEGLPEGWVTPPGWLLDQDGVWEVKGEGKRARTERIAVAPIWISARWRDVDTGTNRLQIAWPGGSAMLRRSSALSHRDLALIGDQGAPVSSQSAAGVVRWLEAAEVANKLTLPLVSQAGRLGWTKDDAGADALQTSDGPHLLRLDDGLAQMQAAIRPTGSWEAWLEAARQVHAASPVAALLLAASVGSVLLQRLDSGAAPFIVDLHGTSTTGKTTALRWACSGWGAPQDGAGLLIGWDTSPTAIEGRAGALRHWPLLLDDTKKIRGRDREALAGLVYNWSSGQGRGRGTVEGAARSVATWRSILISTGEQRLADVCGGRHAGAMLRMLPISAAPFPDDCPAVAVIESLNTWGHLPARIGAWVVQAGDAAIRSRWAEDRAGISKALGGGSRAARLGAMGATVYAGIDVLRGVGVDMPEHLESQIARVLTDGLSATGIGADLAAESWTAICAWIAGCRDRISDRPGDVSDRIGPATGWIGRALEGGRVALIPAAVEGELRRLGYEPGEVVAQWEKRGWLIPGADGKRTQPVRWGGGRPRLWVLDPGAEPDDADDSDAEPATAH